MHISSETRLARGQRGRIFVYREYVDLRVGVIRSAGLRLEATGRNPRHFGVVFDDLDEGVASLCRCGHRVVTNPYHEP